MKKALRAALVGLVVAFALPALAAGEPSPADLRFEALLKSIDVVPRGRAAFERAWPDARERLVYAAQDDARGVFTRIRAIAFLSFFPEPAVRDLLLGLADHPVVEVRRRALYTAGRTFGQPGDRTLVSAVDAATRDPEPRVREHAVRALRWIDHPAAARALERIERGERGAELAKLARHTLERRSRRLERKAR